MMAENEGTKNEIVEVRSAQQLAIDSGDRSRANELYGKELALLDELSGLGREQVEDTTSRRTLAPKSTETSPGDYLLHTNLIDSDAANILGDLVDDPDVVELANVIGATTKAMVSTNRKMAVDAVVDQEKVDEFLDGFTDQEVSQIVASVVNLPLSLTVASRFYKVALKKNPDLDLPDDFRFWLVALPMMEKIYHRLSRTRQEDAEITMTGDESNTRDEYLETLDAFHARIAELQSRGRYTDANRVYADEQAWLASTPGGNQPIVGSQGRTA